jgi:soluble lytic murein transglycosylase-like protein
MSFELSAVNANRPWQAQPARAASPAAPSDPARPAVPAAAATVDTFPASPPPELRAEILAAQQAVQDMYDRGRELRFEMTEGRLRIELRDLDGNVLRTIPGSEALEIASGKAVE